MDLGSVEEKVAALDLGRGFDLIYDLLDAYGFAKSSLKRLQAGSLDKAPGSNEVLWLKNVYWRFIPEGEQGSDVHVLIDAAASDARILKLRPRFLIVSDGVQLVARDMKTSDTLDVPLENLKANASFFLPWAGIEKAQLESLHYADVKAAEKMARLYDEILKLNAVTGSEDLHALNVFFTRLLFCFFAEDTGIFDKGKFTNAVASLTRADGADVHSLLEQIFMVLDTTPEERGDVQSYLREFGYVNGSLFSDWLPVPEFSAKARKIILECGELDWSEINPDIFGSMMQAVVHPGERASLGMHYTSVENIMKVLRPLFLDSLEEAYDEAADDPRKLKKLHDRLSLIKVFDPACGSGNFLVIAYKEIRRFEHRILKRLQELNDDPLGSGLFEESKVKLDHFYGIEIDDFAHEVARLGLWLAKHQMNIQFEELFGPRLPMIPLTDAGQITCGNATRLNWLDICPVRNQTELYLVSNPPFSGTRNQSDAQKRDLDHALSHIPRYKKLDYVAIWLLLAARFVADGCNGAAFVTTNSVCQGEQVAILWPMLFSEPVKLGFAYQSFKWTNQARGQAGVTCVILGIVHSNSSRTPRLYSSARVSYVSEINSYLISGRQVVVRASAEPLNRLPPMTYGSQPCENGGLMFTPAQRDAILGVHPEAADWFKRVTGSDEFLNGILRYCLWVADSCPPGVFEVRELRERLNRIREERARNSREATRNMASKPHLFASRAYRSTRGFLVPIVSSERRTYLPIGLVDEDTVVLNSAQVVYTTSTYVLALIQSKLHMVWLRTVGGQLETRLRYSNTLVYNTFPVPELSDGDKEALASAALSVLAVRQQFPGKTLAELYDPEKMPGVLLVAHQRLDEVVDRLYRKGGFSSDDERLELLFEMYENLTKPGQGVLNA